MNTKEKIDMLFEAYPVLKSIDSDKVIENTAVFKSVETNDYLSSRGSCSGVLFVLKGSIKVKRLNEEGSETNLFNISKGEICHEAFSCLLNYKSLNIVAKAIQYSEVCIIPEEAAVKYLLNSREFLAYMYKDLYNKFNIVIDRKEEKVQLSVEERLIKYLENKKSKIIYATHKEIAFEIDSSREVVSRKLKTFETKGFLKLERGKIIILKDLESK